jgi:hypothetical protein
MHVVFNQMEKRHNVQNKEQSKLGVGSSAYSARLKKSAYGAYLTNATIECHDFDSQALCPS